MPTATELRELDDEELETRLSEYRRELLNLRFQLATGQLDNVSRVNHVRKDVARILTLLRDREIAQAEGRYAGPVAPAEPRAARPPRRRTRADEAEQADEADEVAAAVGATAEATTAEVDELEITGPAGSPAEGTEADAEEEEK